MLEIKELIKTYPGKKPVHALKGVSFTVTDGSVTVLLGPNGAGKSTLLNSINGLVLPDDGEILICGVSVIKRRCEALRHLAVVLEGDRNLFFRLTGYENSEYFIRLGGSKVKRDRIEAAGAPFGILPEALCRQVRTYSKGMRAKLSLIIALLSPGENIVLDEPDTGLDLPSIYELERIIRVMRENGKAVLLATHQMSVAEAVADKVVLINNGRVVGEGLLDELRGAYSNYHCVVEFKTDSVEPKFELPDTKVELESLGNNSWRASLSTANSQSVPEMLRVLAEQSGYELLSVEVEKPALEEVFVRIMGESEE